MKPLIIINFKNYKEAMGANGLKLAAYCSTYDNIIICPHYMELDDVSRITKRVFSQHADPIVEGAYTGKISIISIKTAGASGTLLNHSENRIPFEQIKKTVELLKKHNLSSIVCSETLNEAKRLAGLKPDYIAFEPKKYIGRRVDVTELLNKQIRELVEAVKPVPLLIGAGIDSPDEIRQALELGAEGVIVSSSVVKSRRPEIIIRELASA